MNVIIIGGGSGGLCTALAMRQRGIDAVVKDATVEITVRCGTMPGTVSSPLSYSQKRRFLVLGSQFPLLQHRETSSLAPRCAARGRRLFDRSCRSADAIVPITDPCITNRRSLHRLLDAHRWRGYPR